MAISVHGLRKDFIAPDGARAPVLSVAALAIADGEQVALSGASGSGKTTLLHALAGIARPDAGSIVFTDHRPGAGSGAAVDLCSLSEAACDRFRGRHIGCIFQSHHLLASMSALENVMLGMSFSGRRADRGWAEHLLGEVGLRDRLHHRPRQLSIGQRQRVACARAVANRPALLLADEPTGSLDEAMALQVIDLIRRLTAEVGASALVVSHDPRIVAGFARVVSMSDLNGAVAR